MPVYLLLANLIIEKETVVRKYTGGLEQFRLDYKIGGNNFHQEDDELFCIARMNVDEYDLERHTEKGLHYDWEQDFSTDFVIKRRFDEPLWPAPWLQYSGLFAWHINAKAEQIARAFEIGATSVDEIMAQRDKGIELLGPIRSF